MILPLPRTGPSKRCKFAKDSTGALKAVMEETVDGEYQRYQVKGGAYTRENFVRVVTTTVKIIDIFIA
jgi:pyruvate dehydrogenase complex dehydrogenase (E1) component